MSNIDAARAAKAKAKTCFERLGHVSGVGLCRVDDDYAVKVLLSEPLAHPEAGPTEIDGVSIVVQIVGQVSKQPRS